ncbi:MAG: DMT family transporter [Paracoccaceae bacterium]|nr:DMT family transporter [Paracoccaceae bacterium]
MENLRGIMLMLASMACFAVADMLIKQLSGRVPIGEILLFMGAVGTAIYALWARRLGQKVIGRDFLSPLMVLRNAGEVIGTFAFISAITLTPLSSASAIFQATPLAVTLGAALFMGEAVGWRRWSAILVGFGGVLLIIRPGLDGFEPASLFAVLAVVALSVRDLATRAAPKGISSVRLGTYGFGVLILSGLGLSLFNQEFVSPDLPDLARMTGATALDAAGYYALILAMRMGEVSVITPFRYVRILFALLIGVFVFAERPDLPTLLGTAIIIASGLYTFARERQAARRARQQGAAV